MSIKEASRRDLDDITSLYYQLYPRRGKGGRTRLSAPKLKSKMLVARSRGEVVGFTLATFISYSKSRYGYIEELIVDKKHRNAGIGSKLVKAALRWEKIEKAEVVFVTTGSALEFYKRLGFKKPKKNAWLLWTPK